MSRGEGLLTHFPTFVFELKNDKIQILYVVCVWGGED